MYSNRGYSGDRWKVNCIFCKYIDRFILQTQFSFCPFTRFFSCCFHASYHFKATFSLKSSVLTWGEGRVKHWTSHQVISYIETSILHTLFTWRELLRHRALSGPRSEMTNPFDCNVNVRCMFCFIVCLFATHTTNEEALTNLKTIQSHFSSELPPS